MHATSHLVEWQMRDLSRCAARRYLSVTTPSTAAFRHELTPGKPIRINYAKTKSDAIAKREGTFAPRPKQPLPPKATLPGSALKRDREDDGALPLCLSG